MYTNKSILLPFETNFITVFIPDPEEVTNTQQLPGTAEAVQLEVNKERQYQNRKWNEISASVALSRKFQSKKVESKLMYKFHNG